MKQVVGLGIGLVVGTLVGAAAISGLHAQSNSPVYLVSEVDVTNPQAYAKEFAPKVQATIKSAGGRTIALGGPQGGGAKEILDLEGTAPKRVAIQRWDSMDAVKKWWNSAEYKEARQIGDKYAKFRIFVVDGVNLTQ